MAASSTVPAPELTTCESSLTNRKVSPSMRAFLNKELSRTSCYGAKITRPQRIQSAKGRIETVVPKEKKDSSSGYSTDVSKTKKLYRRPMSAISKKDDYKRFQPSDNRGKCLPSMTRGGSLPSRPLTGKTNSRARTTADAPENKKQDSGCFVFEIHGASILNPSSLKSDEMNQNNGSTQGNIMRPIKSEEERLPLQDESDKGCVQYETSKSESVYEMEQEFGGCFMTETRDSEHDLTDCKATDTHDTGTVSGKDVKSTSQGKVDRRSASICKGVQNSWFSVKPGLFSMQLEEDANIFDSQHSKHSVEDFPYKLQPSNELSLVPIVSDLAEDSCNKKYNSHLGRKLPETLSPLRQFICTEEDEDIVRQLTGISPQNCLVFLPDIETYDICRPDEVPSVQHVDDDLPYKYRVISPKPWAPKKYSHSYKPLAIPKWECKHVSGHLQSERYTNSYRKRTVELVRKEIQELEELLKGIGSYDSDCLMVQYQAEINKLQSTVQTTLAKFPERFRRPAAPEKPDHFGLRKFYKHHDAIIRQIREQHALCVQELAKLEDEAGLLEDERHFSKQDSVVVVAAQNMSLSGD